MEKLLTFVCGIACCVYATRFALHFIHDLVLAAVFGVLVGGLIGGVVAGLIKVTIAEPETLIYIGIALGVLFVAKAIWGHTAIGWLLAW